MSEAMEVDDEECPIPLQCLSIRIGTYKVFPRQQPSIPINISLEKVSFDAPTITGDKIVNITLRTSDISKMLINLGSAFPLIFIITTTSCAESLRRSLNMSEVTSVIYDPTSSNKQKTMITLLITSLCNDQKMFLRKKVAHDKKVETIAVSTANRMLVSSTPIKPPPGLPVQALATRQIQAARQPQAARQMQAARQPQAARQMQAAKQHQAAENYQEVGQLEAQAKAEDSDQPKAQDAGQAEDQGKAEDAKQRKAQAKYQDARQAKTQAKAEDSEQPKAQDAGQAEDAKQPKAQAKYQDAGQAEAQAKAEDLEQPKAQVKYQDAGQAKAQAKAEDLEQSKAQDAGQAEAQDAWQDEGQAEAQDPGQAEAQDPGQAEAQDPGQDEAQDPGQAEAQDAWQAEAQGEAEDAGQAEAQDEGQAEAQDPGQAEAQDPGQAEVQGPGQAEAQDAWQAEAQREAEDAKQPKAQAKYQDAGQAEDSEQPKAQDAGQAEAQDPGQAEAQDPGQAEVQGPGQAEAQDAWQAEAQREAEDAKQPKAQAKYQDAGQAEAQEKTVDLDKLLTVESEQAITLFSYPAIKGRISVKSTDVKCLREGCYINDSIIDFYLMYLYHEKLSEFFREKTHIFNSFFYKSLQSKTRLPDTCDMVPGDELLNKLRMNIHSKVKRWTRSVDLFSKDFILIPVNEALHWFIAIICNPGCISEPSDESPANKYFNDESHLITACEKQIDRNQYTDKKFQNSEEPKQNVCFKDLEEIIKVKKLPCILVLSSLEIRRVIKQCNLVPLLQTYLEMEWQTRKSSNKVFNCKTIPAFILKVPQQADCYNCGIYVLQYLEEFFEYESLDIIENAEFAEKISRKRGEIINLISRLHQEDRSNKKS